MMNLLRNEANKTRTENGDVAYKSTFSANLDFFGLAGASRYNQNNVGNLFRKAFVENPELALMNLLYLRDVRGGLGERESFRACYRILCKEYPKIAQCLISDIFQYGRMDDLLEALCTPTEDEVIKRIQDVLQEDLENLKYGQPTSYLAKWLPSVNTSNREACSKGKYLARKLGMSERQYRKTLSSLRKNKIVENNLREKDYSFKYENVPGRAFHKYSEAFLRNDEERFNEFMNKVKEGKHTLKTKTLYPYDIIRDYSYRMKIEQRSIMNELWNAIPRTSNKSKTIVVRDGSASMWGLPMLISTSLAILFAEQLTGEFNNSFITFSNNPELVQLKGNDLYSKLSEIYSCNDCTNTDIGKVYQLILDVLDHPDFNPEDMFERIVVISDMEFDMGVDNVPTYESLKYEFEKRGYKVPEMVYWNVCARSNHFAAQSTEDNVRFVSGASQNIIESILENKPVLSAYDYMLKVLQPYEHVKLYL